jgi:hypothetical protein
VELEADAFLVEVNLAVKISNGEMDVSWQGSRVNSEFGLGWWLNLGGH